MRITELFTAQSIALDEALQTQEEILSRLVELQATHGNITDKEAYKKASTPARPRLYLCGQRHHRAPRQDRCGHPPQPGRFASGKAGAVQRRG